jgi:hypothetical protein
MSIQRRPRGDHRNRGASVVAQGTIVGEPDSILSRVELRHVRQAERGRLRKSSPSVETHGAGQCALSSLLGGGWCRIAPRIGGTGGQAACGESPMAPSNPLQLLRLPGEQCSPQAPRIHVEQLPLMSA